MDTTSLNRRVVFEGFFLDNERYRNHVLLDGASMIVVGIAVTALVVGVAGLIVAFRGSGAR